MKTKVEALEDDQVRLTVTVDKAEIEERVRKTYKDFAKKYRFPGFRPGKAPRPIIDSALGSEAILATVTDDVTNDTYPLALDAENLIPIDEAKFENQEELVEEGKDFVYNVTMTLKPEFELDSYEPVEIKLPDAVATDEEIEERVQTLREYYYDLEDAPKSTKIGDHGCADLLLHVKDDKGQDIPMLSTDSRVYELGMGLYPDELDEALVDMKQGAEKTVICDLSKGTGAVLTRALEGNPESLTIDVKVNSVKRKVLPEITEEWAKEVAGFEGLEDLHKRTADNMERERKEFMPRMKENACLYQLGDRLQGAAPEVMCIEERRNLLQGFFQQLQQQGITYDAYLKQRDMTNEQFQEDVKKQAADVVKQNLAVDAYARHFKMEVTDEGIEKEFENSGADDIDALKKSWVEEGRMRLLKQSLLRSDAVDRIMEEAKVETVTLADLNKENEAKAAKEAKKPAAKKPAAKKAPAKAAADKPVAKTAAAKKPAVKKSAAKKTEE